VINQLITLASSIPSKKDRIHQEVIYAHILMEALGSAGKDSKSSARCFGSFFELQYNLAGAIIGAKICDYHLDGNRASSPSSNEHNYKVMYALCQLSHEIQDLKHLKLGNEPAKYKVLNLGSKDFPTVESSKKGTAHSGIYQ
jgi:chitin synthase